jgi:hypothetical protein
MFDRDFMTTRNSESPDFVPLSELALSSQVDVLKDSLASEQHAVDEVLASLHDVGSYGKTTETEQPAMRDREIGWLSDAARGLLSPSRPPHEQPSDATLQGGMILLRALGDANESNFQLADVRQVPDDLPIAAPELEAWIGLHQEFDVAIDGLPSDLSANRTIQAAPLVQEEASNQASTDDETPSKEPSAISVGATVVAGAALWVAHQNGRVKRGNA